MISHLTNSEIDRTRWNECVKKCPFARPYGLSWYLDSITPGWEALVYGDYLSVFPLPSFKKYCVRYTVTPPFLQQLGLFSRDESSAADLAGDMMEQVVSRYPFIDLCIQNRIDAEKFSVTTRVNYELDLSLSYDKLWDNFTKHCKRNVETARKHKPEITEDLSPEELVGLFISNRGAYIRGIKEKDYNRLIKLMHYCLENKKGRIMGVRNLKGDPVYGLFLVEALNRMIMLLVANTPFSREKRTGYYIIDKLVKNHAASCSVLDFAGSSIPSIAAFQKSFGSAEKTFYRIYYNNLIRPLRFLR